MVLQPLTSQRVSVLAPIGTSDHSSLSAVISMAQAVPNLCVSRKVFLKHQVNWNTVCGAMQDLPWRNIWSADNPIKVLNERLFLHGGRFVPIKVLRVGIQFVVPFTTLLVPNSRNCLSLCVEGGTK